MILSLAYRYNNNIDSAYWLLVGMWYWKYVMLSCPSYPQVWGRVVATYVQRSYTLMATDLLVREGGRIVLYVVAMCVYTPFVVGMLIAFLSLVN